MIVKSRFFLSRLEVLSLPLHLAPLAIVLSLSTTAHATSIVADGGFEAAGGGNVYYATSSIDGGSWSVTKGAVYVDTMDPYVYDGNNSVNLTYANLYVSNSLSQVLNTLVGQFYYVNFWANADTPNTFSLTENGVMVPGTPNSIANNGFPGAITNKSLFTDYSGGFVATSTTTNLVFTATGDPAIGSTVGSVMIDDVIVQAPEPGSIVLVMTGIIDLALLAGRKRLVRSGLAG
jgi:hypothetical protein